MVEKNGICQIVREKYRTLVFFDPRLCCLTADAAGDYSQRLANIAENACYSSHAAYTLDTSVVCNGLIEVCRNPAVACHDFDVNGVVNQIVALIKEASAHK